MTAAADIPAARTVWRAAPFIFVLFWSGGQSFAGPGLPHTGALTMLTLRYGLAALLLSPWRAGRQTA